MIKKIGVNVHSFSYIFTMISLTNTKRCVQKIIFRTSYLDDK